jgi:hypothetical protein
MHKSSDHTKRCLFNWYFVWGGRCSPAVEKHRYLTVCVSVYVCVYVPYLPYVVLQWRNTGVYMYMYMCYICVYVCMCYMCMCVCVYVCVWCGEDAVVLQWRNTGSLLSNMYHNNRHNYAD